MKKIFILLSLLYSLSIQGQFFNNQFYYDANHNVGSAKYTSLAGAMGAIGGDISSLSENPAGIGVYRSSEYGITLDYTYQSTNSTYSGQTSNYNKQNTGIADFHYVKSIFKRNEDKAIKFINYGFSWQKKKDYNRAFRISSDNMIYSITDFFAQQGNGYEMPKYLNAYNERIIDWNAFLAWNTYLINDKDDIENQYERALAIGDKMNQQAVNNNSGSEREFSSVFGFNLYEKVYIGTSLNIDNLKYNSYLVYRETAVAGNESDLTSVTYENSTQISGVGLNLKVGIILKPLSFLRLGMSYKSPTLYTLDSNYGYYARSDYNNSFFAEQWTPTGVESFKFKKPAELQYSGAIVLRKFGFINIDFKTIDLSSMYYSNIQYDDDFQELNNNRFKNSKKASVLKVGGEFILGMKSIRLGYSTFNLSNEIGNSVFSGGFGMKYGAISIDFSCMYNYEKNSDVLFESNSYSFNSYQLIHHNISSVVSLNFRF